MNLNSNSNLINFLNSKGAKNIRTNFRAGIGLFDFNIRIIKKNRTKISIIGTVLDGNFEHISFKNDSIVFKNSSQDVLQDMYSVSVASRIGIMATFIITQKLAISAYHQFRPQTTMLLPSKFDFMNVENSNKIIYTVKSEPFKNFNLGNEIGLKFHIGRLFYLAVFHQTGNWNISTVVNGSPKGTLYEDKSYITDVRHNFWGFRIGF